MKIEGLSHITLVVRNLEKTARLLTHVLDAEEVYSSGDDTFSISREKFFRIGGVWLCTMAGGGLPKSYNHVAFKIKDADFDAYCARARAAGAQLLPSRPRVSGEGRSLYFYDFDGHLFELHTGSLAERLARYQSGR